MKILLLAGMLVFGAASVNAAGSVPPQDSTMHKKMHHDKMKMDSSGKKAWKNSDSSMHNKPMYKKKKMDSTSTH